MCSTKVDNSGEHVEGQGNYGICEQKCQPKPYYKDKNQFLSCPEPFEPVIGDLEQLPPDTNTEWFMGTSFNTGSSVKALLFSTTIVSLHTLFCMKTN